MSEKVQVIIFSKVRNSLEVLRLQTNDQRGAFWQNITGGVEPEDNSLLKAAQREVKEETGIEITPVDKIKSINFFFDYHDQSRGITYKEHVFYTLLTNKPTVRISGEHQGYCWKNVNDIIKSDFKFESNHIGFCEALKEVNAL